MERISVRAHLLILLTSWIAAIAIIAWFAVAGLREDRGVIVGLTQNHMPSIQALQVMREAYTEIRLNNLTTAIYENDERAAASIQEVMESRKLIWAEFIRGWRDYGALPRDEQEDTLWKNFEKAHEGYRAAESRTAAVILELAKGGYDAAGQRRLFKEFYLRYRQAERPIRDAKRRLDELALLNLETGRKKAESAMALGAKTLRGIFWVSILVAAFSLSFGPILARRIFRQFEEKMRLEQALKAAVETRDEFLSVAAHDLKNTLSGLGLRVNLLYKSLAKNQKLVGEPALVLGRDASRLVEKFGKMLDQLLDVTRIRVGALQLRPVPLDLRASLLEVVDSFREPAESKGSSIAVTAPDAALGRWDPVRIQQVLSNLISNAVKYGEGRPIEVTLESDVKAEVVRLKVKDHGPGIPAEIQTVIFEPFQRAARDHDIEGLGLGLYIVRKIVAAHGGSLVLQSAPGSGSEFTVELPMKAEPETRAA